MALPEMEINEEDNFEESSIFKPIQDSENVEAEFISVDDEEEQPEKPIKKVEVVENKPMTTTAEEKPKSKRGRKPGTKMVNGKLVSKEEAAQIETQEPKKDKKEEKKETPKEVNIMDTDLDILMQIYTNYSTKPVKELSKELKISVQKIEDIVKSMSEILSTGILDGSITEDEFNQDIQTKLVSFDKKKNSSMEKFKQQVINEIKNKRK